MDRQIRRLAYIMPGWDWVHDDQWTRASEGSERESACSSRNKRRKPVREGRIEIASSLMSVNGSSKNCGCLLFERYGTQIRKHCCCFNGIQSLFKAHRIPVSLTQRPIIDKAYKMSPLLAYQSQTRPIEAKEASVSSQSLMFFSIVISWPACRLARVGVPVGVKPSQNYPSKVPFGPFRPCRSS